MKVLTLGMVLMHGTAALAAQSNKAYQLGHGYQLGSTGIQLGGYASSTVSGLGDIPWKFEVNDLSVFVSWNANDSKLSFFSELEVEDVVAVSASHSLSTEEAHFSLERFYVDYLVNDMLTVRVGKFLTPIGQWNVVHADPLVWTTTRPVATDKLFDKHVAGIMLHGTVPLGDQSLDYALYGDNSTNLDPIHEINPIGDFDNAVGMRLRYNLNDDLQLGMSYADFALSDFPSVRHHLLGFDVAWTYQYLSLTSEIVYRNNDSTTKTNAWQGYVQGVGTLSKHFYAVARYEFFDQYKNRSDHYNNQFGQVGVLGLAYRPVSPMIWKLEYRYGVNNQFLAPDGLFASFSVLF